MADDEVLRIGADTSGAVAGFDRLGNEVRELEAELKTLNETEGVTNAEIEGTTRRLEEAKEKFAEAGQEVEKFNATQEEGGKKTGGLADKYVTLGLKVFGARQVLMALGDAMKSVAIATDSYSGATKDAIDEVGNLASSIASLDLVGTSAALGRLTGQTIAWAEGLNDSALAFGNLADAKAAFDFAQTLSLQNDLVQSHKEEVEALNKKSEALSREIGVQTQAGEVQKYIRDAVLETLDAYAKAGEEVPANLAAQAAALGIVSTEQAKTAASAEKLEAVSVAGSDNRATAEEAAAARIIAALDAESKAADAKLAADEARLAALLAKGDKIDTSQQTSAAKEELRQLQQQIKALENTPLISPDELNKLNEMKDRAAALKREVSDLNNVFTQTADDFLTESEAADAAGEAWDVYGDRLEQAQIRHERALNEFGGATDIFDDVASSADDAAESFGDVADAGADIGKKTKKGADAASEGIDKMKEGLEEAIPLAETLRGILQEIVALGAQADI